MSHLRRASRINPNPRVAQSSSTNPSPDPSPNPKFGPGPDPRPNPDPDQASLADTARPILLSGSPLLLRAVPPPEAQRGDNGGGEGGGEGGGDFGSGGDGGGGAYLRVNPLEHPAVSVQPLPGWLQPYVVQPATLCVTGERAAAARLATDHAAPPRRADGRTQP